MATRLAISPQKVQQAYAGFVMPMVLILMTTIMIIVLIVNQGVVLNQRQVVRYSYNLMARAAAKGAADYAKEELDSNLSYCGTPENRNSPTTDPNSTVLHDNTDYKVTYAVEIYDGVCTGANRTIRAIGRVYIPEISVTAAYIQDIRIQLVRSGLNTDSPADLSPVAWYRADLASSVLQTANSSFTGSFNYASRLEEQLNGTVQNAVCGGSNADLEFHTGNENTGEQRIGLSFNSLNIPRNATITNAYVQFRSGGSSGTGGTNAQLSQALTTRIRGFNTASKAAFTCPGGGQLNNTGILTASQVDWAMAAWNTQNQSSAAQRTPDISAIVQAIVNRSDWNSGNNLGLRFEKVSGSGLRNASVTQASHIQLRVDWTTVGGSTAAATDGTTVIQWQDQTSNDNDLTLVSGTPVLKANQLNSKQVVEFTASGATPAMLADLSLTPTITSTTGITVLAVMKPINTGSSGGGDHFVSLLNTAQPNDTGAPAANGNVRPFMRSGLTGNMTASANGYTAQPLGSVIGSSYASGQWGVYAFTANNGLPERFSRSGSPGATFDGGEAISFSLNQLLLGGTSSAASVYTLPGNMQLAELAVFDKLLSCSQIRLLENYYSQSTSWNIATTGYNCPLQ